MSEGRDILEGRVAVITGAGRGIGRAIALAYARAGAAVVCAARTESEIEALASEVRAAGGQALAVPTDVTHRERVETLFERASEAFGGIDIAVLGAGGLPSRGGVAGSDPEAWATTIELNLLGAYYCARAVVPHLRARGGGKIITVGSGIGHRGTSAYSAYACAKAGQWMLTRVLAQELAADGISVNELIPGPVAMEIGSEPKAAGIFASEWLKTPDDVVPLALFLATQPEPGPSAQSYSLMRRDT
jgi:3-oxoacyl-[acyl-carrier protein] reductase